MSYAVFSASDLAAASVIEDFVAWRGTGDRVEPVEFSERDRVDLLNDTSPRLTDYRYRLRAVESYAGGAPRDILEILPVPVEDLFGVVYYLPQLTLGEVEGDVTYQGVKGIAEEWLILDVLLTVKGKTDEAATIWRERRAEVQAQLLAQAGDRDAAQPKRIRQVWERTGVGRERRKPWRAR